MSNLNVNAISPQSGSTLRLTSNLNITGHVTASGNISASGTVFADNFQSTGGDVAGISFNDDFNLTGDMTGSGNLEIAGNISGSSTSTGSFGHVRMNGKDLPPIFVTGSSIYLGGEGTGTGDDGSDNNNVGIGDDVLSGIGTGARNVAIGLKAMENRVAASENVAIGYRAGGPGAQKMGQNTLVGVDAGYSLDGSGGTYNATSNTYIGHQAGDGATEGLKNTAIGDNSARSLVAGSSNVFLGYFSGNGGNTEGGTYIGENTVATDGASREIVIGKTAIGKGSNTVVLGDDNITDIYMSEDVGAKLHTGDVSGSAISTGSFGELKISGVGQEKISLLGGTDQYINFGDADDYNIGAIKYRHSSDNQMQFITNNTMGFFITNNQDIGMKATGKFYFDGGFNTFFAESSADNIRFTAGAVPILDLTTTSISGSSTSTGSFATIRTGTTIGSLSSGISFGDGDTGIYEKTDDNIVITAGNSLESLKIAPTAVTWRTDSFNINTSTNTYYGIRMSPDNSTNTILLAGSGHQTIDFSKTGVLKTSTTTNSNGAAFTFQGTMDQLGSFSATSQFVKLDPVMSSSNAVATSSYTMLDMAGTIDMTGQTQETIRSLHIHPTKTNIVNYTAIDADGDIITTGNISGSATSTGSFGRIESSGDMGIDGNIDVKGNVTARNFIVSSSVTNITYQSLSGSTIFGDSADDTHVFGGNTISGSATSTGSFGRVESTTAKIPTLLGDVSIGGQVTLLADEIQGSYNPNRLRFPGTQQAEINDIFRINSSSGKGTLGLYGNSSRNSTTLFNFNFNSVTNKFTSDHGSVTYKNFYINADAIIGFPGSSGPSQAQDISIFKSNIVTEADHGPGRRLFLDFRHDDVDMFTADMSGSLYAFGNISGSSTSTGSFGILELDKFNSGIGHNKNTNFGIGAGSTGAGEGNLAIGYNAGDFSNAGSSLNIAIGWSAQGHWTDADGDRNIAIGYQSMYDHNGGDDNIAIGYQAMKNGEGDGSDNIAIGTDAMQAIGAGASSNIGMGDRVMHDLVGGTDNIAFGATALYKNVAGDYNVALGTEALYGINAESADKNVAVGYRAGIFITDGSTVFSDGDSNVFIGSETKPAADDESNQIIIGANAVGKGSNTALIGDDNITDIYMSEDVGATLHTGTVSGSAISTGSFGAIQSAGDITPKVDDTSDLGSAALRFSNVFTTDLQLSNEGKPEGNEVDGTTGSWTIQEGEDNLYLLNRKNGKKYKFKLEEIG